MTWSTAAPKTWRSRMTSNASAGGRCSILLTTGSYQSAGTASTQAGARNTTVAPRQLASSGPARTTEVLGCASWVSLQPRWAAQKATTACRLTVVVMLLLVADAASA